MLALGFTTEEFGNVHIDLEKLASNYEAVDEKEKNSFLNRIVQDRNKLKGDHKPPYDLDIFKPWA